MGTYNAPAVIRQALAEQQRDYMWLHRQTGIKYKAVLAEIKHGKRVVSLPHAVLYAKALHISISKLAAAA